MNKREKLTLSTTPLVVGVAWIICGVLSLAIGPSVDAGIIMICGAIYVLSVRMSALSALERRDREDMLRLYWGEDR